ncbi:MAG TPA: bifunctional phosphoribosylaminoimidazolecarboxamide formyltransferase/IMP cyclohydrolase [Methylomirabilota bacterium]|nr:bifunctional phosphoribosylaminoimidazolecarboxamide formyltransferase/IMP cyclohydrolase [Methylomirabilota bacterium]
MKVSRALVSVHDKTGIVEFARGLHELGVEVLSTGGTARLLREAGVPVRDVSEVTGFPELLDGRVKTLHPKIHGGILARRDSPEHLAALERHGIPLIDLVVVSLYPFEATVARPEVDPAEAIEQIDIGGPTMIRAAAKNHAGVAIVTDASQYAPVLTELRRSRGALSEATLRGLAREAFRRTAQYDAAIAAYLQLGGNETFPPKPPDSLLDRAGGSIAPATTEKPPKRRDRAGASIAPATTDRPTERGVEFPERLRVELERVAALRYGENPHQAAALYREAGSPPAGLGAMRQLHGPELGYNNLLDLSAALGLLLEFEDPAAVVVKHTNPCGVARGTTVAEAMARAKESDPVSIYGGIVGVNRELDMGVVAALSGIFVEILFAPTFTPDALEELRRTKKKCRVMELPWQRGPVGPIELRSVRGGMLAQSPDDANLDPAACRVVSRRQPSAEERAALGFAWQVAKHVKSNAIVLATRDQVIGVGAGQMNRVDSARLAVLRAAEAKLSPRGAVCASDAFFPFRDGLDVVARAGITAVIQPGGSLRDAEVTAAADEHGMAMIFTGIRHFRH